MQGLQNFYRTGDQVNRQLRGRIMASFREMYRIKELHGVSLRMAAYMPAMGRVAKAKELRGLYP